VLTLALHSQKKSCLLRKSEKSVQNPEKDLLPRHAVIRQPCMRESECLGIPARVVTMTSLPALQSAAQQFALSLGNCGVTGGMEKKGTI
jgi:hypothetical protein